MRKLNIPFTSKFNFYRNHGVGKLNSIKINSRTGLGISGQRILRFRKPLNKSGFNLILDMPLNHNTTQLRSTYLYKLSSVSFMVRSENIRLFEQHLVGIFEKETWGCSRFCVERRFAKLKEIKWVKFSACLVFCLRSFFKTFRHYFSKQHLISNNGLYSGIRDNYWNELNFLKTPLTHLGVGTFVEKGIYKNFNFSLETKHFSVILSKSAAFCRLLLPSGKVTQINQTLTLVNKVNSLNSILALETKVRKNHKLSWGKKPRVRGKAMNVFDRPNGGFKHSAKILKTFKGQKILK